MVYRCFCYFLAILLVFLSGCGDRSPFERVFMPPKGESIFSARFFPDGCKVAVLTSRNVPEFRWRLYVCGKGGRLLPIMEGEGYLMWPLPPLSPDGRYALVTRKRGFGIQSPPMELLECDLKKGSYRPLFRGGGTHILLARPYSPDGGRVVARRVNKGRCSDLVVWRRGVGKRPVSLPDSLDLTDITWAPGGQWIYGIRDGAEVVRIKSDGREREVLYRFGPKGSYHTFAFSQDARWVAAVNRSERMISIVNIQTKEEQCWPVQVPPGEVIIDMEWAPNGLKLFANTGKRSAILNLTPGPEQGCWQELPVPEGVWLLLCMDWSPDSTQILMGVFEHGASWLAVTTR